MLEPAIAAAAGIKRALEAEVGRAKREREVLRSLDPERLFGSADARAAFNLEIAERQAELGAALRTTAAAMGLRDVTLDGLVRRAPREGQVLVLQLADIRALVTVLAELDRLNLQVAGRALACVQGYLSSLDPRPSSYDRYGARAVARTIAAISTKV